MSHNMICLDSRHVLSASISFRDEYTMSCMNKRMQEMVDVCSDITIWE